MYATIRRYKNAGPLAEAMTAKKDEVMDLIKGVPGFVAYYATRDGDTMTSVSIYNDKAGGEESTRRAGEWVRASVSSLPSSPDVSGGEVFVNFT
jgi:hypothetical protein